jgi:cytochrome c oxidase subunit 2
MAFEVVVHEKEDFERWLDQQARPAESPDATKEERGQRVFLSSGCGACHTVRGIGSDGAVGPDLTHVGGRESLGGAILPNDEMAFAHWISQTDVVKPQVHMPHFGMLPTDDLEALAAYLEGLK